MKLPRDLSGTQLSQWHCKDFDDRRVNQEGSHVVLESCDSRQHRISIPDHAPLRIGTLNAILRAIARGKGLEKEDILRHL